MIDVEPLKSQLIRREVSDSAEVTAYSKHG